MSQTAPAEFLDVPRLLEQSQPRGSGLRLGQFALVFIAIIAVSTYLSTRGGAAAQFVSIFSALLMLGLMGAMMLISWIAYRAARDEQTNIEAIEELIRLRRWEQASSMLNALLSRPTRTHQARAQGLIFLTGVLARYNRFEDAIHVQDYLLEHMPLDGGTAHGLRLARAMAMLREDHLVDADRAINDLRRQVNRAGRLMNEERGEEASEETPQSISAGLALIELYRDVKTGHPAEAIELFNSTVQSMRDQLGHRVADAYVLAARAHDMLNRPADAQWHYHRATLLAPAEELHRRYPETSSLAQKYAPAVAPEVQA